MRPRAGNDRHPRSPLRRILLVEDDRDIRAVAAYALESIGGYEVAACGDGKAALAAVEAFRADLALLDVMLPGMDGPALLPLLRRAARDGDLPVVFLTARSDPEEMTRYRRIGAIDVITKPFDPLALPAQVDALWRRVFG